jgi:hypothetical protein
VLVLEVSAELLESRLVGSASLVTLAAEDMVGIFPKAVTVKTAAILSVVEGLESV